MYLPCSGYLGESYETRALLTWKARANKAVVFPNVVLDADAYVPGAEESKRRKLKSLEDVVIR